jgi:hypothetical protein
LRRRRGEPNRDGCGFLLLTCVFTCFFLILNVFAVSWFYPVLAALGPAWLKWQRVEQVILFMAPVLLIFLEWWCVDLIVDLLTPGRGRQSEDRAGKK